MLNSPNKMTNTSSEIATPPVEGEAYQMVNHNADVEQPPNNKHNSIKKLKNTKPSPS